MSDSTAPSSLSTTSSSDLLTDHADFLKPVRRLAVIDGCNFGNKVRISFLPSDHTAPFNGISFLLAVHELIKRKFEVLITIKDFYMSPKNTKHLIILEKLKEMEVLQVLPDVIDDDVVILNTAHQTGGFIISNDKYAQYTTPEHAMAKIRRIPFDYVPEAYPSNDLLKSTEGRFKYGVKLRFGTSDELKRLGMVEPGDPLYRRVSLIYDNISPTYFKDIMRKITMMADYLQRQACIARNLTPPALPYIHLLEKKEYPDYYAFEEAHDHYHAHLKFSQDCRKQHD